MKIAALPFGKGTIPVSVPDSTDVMSAGSVTALATPRADVEACLAQPIGTPPLAELARGAKSAVVVVSDNTRPVPYREPDGILGPILGILKGAAIQDITVIVACGTHRPMKDRELRGMLGAGAFQRGVRVVNHLSTDPSELRRIGRTERTADVTVNRRYLDAELKIVTGLVEPHFMAGFSGGRKAVCPGISGQNVTYTFHSAEILNHERTTTLVLDGNPCHEEALTIAKMAGVDFAVNVTIDSLARPTGVFAGDLEASHSAAVKHLRSYATIPINQRYDLVITQAGAVGLNHYQCVKAAFEASRAVKPGGSVIVAADLTDTDPVGGANYKKMLRMGVKLGFDRFVREILSADWVFVPEQWEVQMWAKVFSHLGDPKRLHLCAPRLADADSGLFLETNVPAQVGRNSGECDPAYAQRCVQHAIDTVLAGNPQARVAVLPDGPYAIPVPESLRNERNTP